MLYKSNTDIDQDFTGERYLPSIGGSIELEHLHRYRIISEIVKDKVVADIACGEGYGSSLLAKYSKSVVGVDISSDTIEHAQKKYKKDNLHFICASGQDTKLQSETFDIIVSFETIEHHDKHDEMLIEFLRILKKDGLLIISSPDKFECTDKTGIQNPHHVKELYKEEFENILSKYFSNVKLYGQKVISGSAINSLENYIGYDIDDLESEHHDLTQNPMFWIAIASNSQTPKLPRSILHANFNIDHLLLAQYENDIRKKTIVQRDADLLELTENLNKSHLQTEFHQKQINNLQNKIYEYGIDFNKNIQKIRNLEINIEKLTHERDVLSIELAAEKSKSLTNETELQNLLHQNHQHFTLWQDTIQLNHHHYTQLLQLHASLSWRLTKPLRFAVDLMPNNFRKLIRRVAKATWWAMTPWKISQRLALRKTSIPASNNTSELISRTKTDQNNSNIFNNDLIKTKIPFDLTPKLETELLRTLQVQYVLYELNTDEFIKSYKSLIIALQQGLIHRTLKYATILIGDCSTKPLIDEPTILLLKEIARKTSECISVQYEFFDSNLGTSTAHNRFGLNCDSDYIHIINPDTRISPEFYLNNEPIFRNVSIGICDARQIPMEHPKLFDPVTYETSWASGASSIILTSAFKEVMGYDASSFFLYCDDVDLSWRIRLAGYRIIHLPTAVIFHDKRISNDGIIIASDAEQFYSCEAALIIAHKYSRDDIIKNITEWIKISGSDIQLKALTSYLERKASNRLPKQIDQNQVVAEFINGNYAAHRF